MKIHNLNGCLMFFMVPVYILVMVWIPYFIVSEWSDYGVLPLLVTGPVWLWFLFSFREWFCPYVIDEKGITSKMPFRNIFIAWDEMEYIAVGAQRGGREGKYRFIMHFSKIPIKKSDIFKGKVPITQKRTRFFIVYENGLLEEVLKHVDEEKIKNIEWIKDCQNPSEWQHGFTLLRKFGEHGHWAGPRG